MPRGASVVLFSDGLVESDPAFGEAELDALLARSTSATAAELSLELHVVAAGLRRVHADDIAVIILQRT
jgi:serine phosphatase RsbU (regulator of sigma subunit)